MIDCVSIATSNQFTGNLVRDQHRLRYREVIIKGGWQEVYAIHSDKIEFDRYDTVATEYLVSRNRAGRVVGVIRTNPTTIPYMLEERFRCLITGSLPQDPHIFETSRLVVDRTRLKTHSRRAVVVDRLLVALMERGLQQKLSHYIGFMIPKIWDSTFRRIGWEPEWLGPELPLQEYDYTVRAGIVRVERSIYKDLKKSTGLTGRTILNFGQGKAPNRSVARPT